MALLVTAVFGDFVVKRNIDSYLAQREAFEQSVLNADQEFMKFYYDLEGTIRERRRQAQLLIRYARSKAYKDFAQQYADYEAQKDIWNQKLQVNANEILRVTGCRRTQETGSDVIAQRKQDFLRLLERGRDLGVETAEFVDEEEIEYITQDGFCPTHFLTLDRSKPEETLPKVKRVSVQEHFLAQNSVLYNLKTSAFVDCRLRYLSYRESLVSRCFNRLFLSGVRRCIQGVEEMFSKNEYCEPHATNSKPSPTIPNEDFDKFDYRWFLGKELLRLYRKPYVVKECELSRVFWARLLSWNCGSRYDEMIGQRAEG